MSKEERIEHLEQEKGKIWERIVELEELLTKRTSGYEAEAKESAENAAQFKITSEEAKNTVTQNLVEANSYLDKLKQVYATFEKLNTDIQEFSSQSKNNSDALKTIYDDILTKAVSVQNQITEIEKITTKKPELDEKIIKLTEIFSKGDDYDSKLGALHESITERKKEIDKLYYKIIGFEEKNEKGEVTQQEKGLKGELTESFDIIKSKLEVLEKEFSTLKEDSVSNYSKFSEERENKFNSALKNWKDDYQKILKQIENLLPNALTAGLSAAYSEKKSVEEKDSEKLAVTFKNAIFGLIAISLIPFTISVVSIFQKEDLEIIIYRIPRLVLAILPLYVPVLWVAYSANRKMNLAKRLIEEYSHKEVLSKTFEGLSKQINNISDKDISEDLRIKLLYNILEVNSENPGKLISDYNKSDHPLMDALDKSIKLSNAVSKLAKIPGLKKLASSLAQQSEAILDAENRKAEAAIETVDVGNSLGKSMPKHN